MRRRAAVVLAFLLVFCALAPQLSARADGVCFTVINETILDLSGGTMPQTLNGAMCVPYSVFGNSAFGLYAAYSSSRGTLTFMNAAETVIFDLNIGIAYTSDGTIYNSRASARNGTIYVPVGFLCQIYGWSWSYLETGPCVRICTGAARVNDALFIGLTRSRLEEKKNAYLGVSEKTPQPSRRPETPSSGQTSDPSESSSPSQEPVKQILCALYGAPGDATGGMLDALGNLDRKALVFLFPEDFSQRDEDLLRLVSEGHLPGFSLMPPSDLSQQGQDAWFDQLEQYNDRLFQVTLTRAGAVHLRGGSAQVTGPGADSFFRRLEQSGYRLWDYSVTVEGSRSAESLRQQLSKTAGVQVLAFPMTDSGAESLRAALWLTATEKSWSGRSVTELTIPRNQRGN